MDGVILYSNSPPHLVPTHPSASHVLCHTLIMLPDSLKGIISHGFFHLPFFFFFFCLWGPSHFTRNWNGRYPTQNESHRILYCVFIDYKQKYTFCVLDRIAKEVRLMWNFLLHTLMSYRTSKMLTKCFRFFLDYAPFNLKINKETVKIDFLSSSSFQGQTNITEVPKKHYLLAPPNQMAFWSVATILNNICFKITLTKHGIC